ncbi:type VI secretion system secreted protein VgrG [Singulisphaera sp. GP187]|uniref:type VI secretion system Vgr family protein n=1 Tax=Singulisphaera sp. GP187 TaxID=1882752 RepID=UPI0009293334|nr:type VI secretion system tip protein TssI/VgrG [Singulisphaera sp. GP187]SIO61747.1 type VI secretion system secreted protein VgrG [Singulisphaera sp. GP187]
MATYLQADRIMTVTTPLKKDALLMAGFSGHESISQLFEYRLELFATNDEPIPFEMLLGQKAIVRLALEGNKQRFFSGICNRVSQGARDNTFTAYHLDVVPQFWFLTKRAQSRIFQQVSVPQILQQVLAGLDVSYDLRGTYQPRDYCVQYRETDYNFACRLMEEEGIFFFFKHSANGHTLVVTDVSQACPELAGKARMTLGRSEEEVSGEELVLSWEKTQELRSGRYLLWDHSFELPHKHLEADKQIADSVMAGQVSHKLRIGNNDKLELYDYPGEYAQRFDGINPSGGDRAGDLQKIFDDNKRTVEIRMQEEAAASLSIQGEGTCRSFATGHTVLLDNHFNANGKYLITGIRHMARQSYNFRSSNESAEFSYRNSFTCMPFDLPYRPARKTPKPAVQGTQTAVVVGPAGEEIFTDKYGRVKVQFHWDRQGKNDNNSSCWIRVGTPWAGKNWGMIHIPRIGQEVIVDFQEGDPDQPIIIGSVYNAAMMPPYDLPANKTQSGVKTRSSLRGSEANFNELRFEDKKGEEDVYFHAEKDFHRVVERDDDLKVHRDQTVTIDRDRTEQVKRNEKVTVDNNRDVIVSQGNDTHNVKMGNRAVKIDMGNDALTIKMGNQTTKLDLGKSETQALQSIELKVGQSSIKIDQTGVQIKGMMIDINGQVQTQVKGLMTQISASAILQMKGGLTMIG